MWQRTPHTSHCLQTQLYAPHVPTQERTTQSPHRSALFCSRGHMSSSTQGSFPSLCQMHPRISAPPGSQPDKPGGTTEPMPSRNHGQSTSWPAASPVHPLHVTALVQAFRTDSCAHPANPSILQPSLHKGTVQPPRAPHTSALGPISARCAQLTAGPDEGLAAVAPPRATDTVIAGPTVPTRRLKPPRAGCRQGHPRGCGDVGPYSGAAPLTQR